MEVLLFYLNRLTGKVIPLLGRAQAPDLTLGEEFTELIPGTVDAAHEKHIPVVSRSGTPLSVSVGSVQHPMLSAHFIQWVAMETNQGCQIKYLQPETVPQVTFALAEGEEVIAVYEYCNLHCLQKTEV